MFFALITESCSGKAVCERAVPGAAGHPLGNFGNSSTMAALLPECRYSVLVTSTGWVLERAG